MEFFQEMVFEQASIFMDRITAACVAGFAIYIDGEFYLTPAGDRYLDRLDRAEAAR